MIIILLSFLGFLNAFFLYYQHRREVTTGQKMFCLIGGDCGAVVGSKYGRTLGIKNELWGLGYYTLLIIYSFLTIIWPHLVLSLAFWVKQLVLIASIFSLYLLIVQTFILRQFCSWCLIAIAINLLTFYLLTI